MHNVIVVEDSEECQLVVRQALAQSSVNIFSAGSVAKARELFANTKQVELVLLDIGLPDGDGMALLTELQSKFKDVPVLFMTSRAETTSKIVAFSLGAEDYLVKPVDPFELRARVEMRLRKSQSRKLSESTLKRGQLTLETSLLKATVENLNNGMPLDLTTKEFKILAFLALHEGDVFSRRQLVDAIWGNNVHVLDRTIDSHVCSLRKKLGACGKYVESIPSAGYRFLSRPS